MRVSIGIPATAATTGPKPVTNDPTPPPQAAAAPTGADAIAALARTEHRMVRLTAWQTLLSVAGAVIAVLALFATLRESEEVRRQTAAAVWPYVQLQVNDFDRGDEAGLSLAVTNTGVGPAKVRTLRIELDGQAVAGWPEALAALGLPADSAYSQAFLAPRVLAPGETVVIFDSLDPALARALRDAIGRPGTGLALCYCSIFEECWRLDSRLGPADPQPVPACPAGPGDFRAGH